MKLVSNSTVLVPTAILGLPMLDAVAVPGMRDLMLRAGQEALDTASALGHPILPIFGLTADEVSHPDRGGRNPARQALRGLRATALDDDRAARLD